VKNQSNGPNRQTATSVCVLWGWKLKFWLRNALEAEFQPAQKQIGRWQRPMQHQNLPAIAALESLPRSPRAML
jgi:hypothetical protein